MKRVIPPVGFTLTLMPADVLVQGAYPGYSLRFFEERGIEVVTEDGIVHDSYRVRYFRDHIALAREAVADGVDLRGYFAWGAMDNVSASSCEMSKRYGFIYVDQDDWGHGSGKRTPKENFAWMQRMVRSNGADPRVWV